jgi:hypothetical protein
MAPVIAAGKAKLKEADTQEWQRRSDRKVPGVERAQLRARWAAHVAGLQRSGEVLNTQAAIVEFAARRAMAQLGWDRVDWPPAPEEAELEGRRPGSSNVGATERFTVQLDSDLAAKVYAACWATSSEAMRNIMAWRDRNPGLIDDAQEISYYDDQAGKVTTVGDVWRLGLALILPRLPPKAEVPADDSAQLAVAHTA